MFFPPDIQNLAAQIVSSFAKNNRKLCVAESCTGGLIASAITSVAGSSAVFERGFVTYSPESKTEVLGILSDELERCGIVSEDVAEQMAIGALSFSQADVALSVTGYAGPCGGTPEAPVGTVIFGAATRDGARFHLRCAFEGPRDQVRLQAVEEGLRILRTLAEA